MVLVRSLRRVAVLVLFFLLPSMVACGKKGPPRIVVPEAPAAPTVSRLVHREDSILLAWDISRREEKPAGLSVLRSSGNGFERIAELPESERLFADKQITSGKKYCYKIVTREYGEMPGAESASRCITLSEVPLPPVDVSFTIADGALSLRWGVPGKGLSYNVYRSFVKDRFGTNPLNDVPVTTDSYVDIFSPDRPVYYVIRSVEMKGDSQNESRPSPEVTVDPSELVPGPPGDATCDVHEERTYLMWRAPSQQWVRGFRVYRATEGENYELVGRTDIPAYVDKDVRPGKTSYRITAVGPVREGPPAQVSCTPLGTE
jgi:predicted small lipoprotein YifL